MRVCPACGRPNKDSGSFCIFCGGQLPTSTAPPPPPPPSIQPPPPPPPSSPPVLGGSFPNTGPGVPSSPPARWGTPVPVFERPRKYPNRRRLLTALVLIAASLFALIALVTPWWSISLTISPSGSYSGGSWTGYLMPGSSAASSCSGDCYGLGRDTGVAWNHWLTATNGLYEGILALVVLALISAFFATFLGLRGATSPTVSRRSLTVLILATFVATLLMLVAIALVVAAQPGTLSSDFSTYGTPNVQGLFFCASGASPTNSFWGSNSGSCNGGQDTFFPVGYSWGASVGWYAALVSLLLLLFALLLLMMSWREMRATVPASAPGPTVAPPPPPPSTPTEIPHGQFAPAQGPSILPPPPPYVPAAPPSSLYANTSTPVYCPRCGMPNPIAAPSCTRCQLRFR